MKKKTLLIVCFMFILTLNGIAAEETVLLNNEFEELKNKNAELSKILEMRKNELDNALGTIAKYENQLQTFTNLTSELKRKNSQLEMENAQKKELEQKLLNYSKLIENKTNENFKLSESLKLIESENKKLNGTFSSLRAELDSALDKLKLKTIEVNTIIKEKYELLEINERISKRLNLLESERSEKIAAANAQSAAKKEMENISRLNELLSSAAAAAQNSNFGDALTIYEAADKINSDSDIIKYNIALLAYQLSDFAKAEEYINSAIKLNPEILTNKILKLQILIKSEKYLNAVKYVQTLNISEKKDARISRLIDMLFK